MNMDREIPFKIAQKDFVNWVSKWANLNEKENTIEPDVIQLVALLQVLGYKIGFIDKHDIAPTQNGEYGLKIMITCGHSGLRCILERPSECQCPLNLAEVFKCQITSGPKSMQEESQEIGSVLLSPIPIARQKVIKSVMNHIFHMVTSPTNDVNQNSVCTPSKYTQSPHLHRNSPMALNVITNNPKFNIKSPEAPMSPTRYRSLDTLTGTVDLAELPPPGILTKTPKKPIFPSLTMSSPNLLVTGRPSMTSSPVDSANSFKDEYTKLKHAQELVNDVVSMYENRQPKSLLQFDISKIKGSTESLPVIDAAGVKKEKHSPNKSTELRIKSVKPMCRPPIRYGSIRNTANSGLIKPSTITPKNITSIFQSASPTNTIPTRTKIAGVSSATKNLKYSHIKSTIPKHTTKK